MDRRLALVTPNACQIIRIFQEVMHAAAACGRPSWCVPAAGRVVLVRREREELLRNIMDVLLSLEGEYILSTRLGGQEASPGDKVGDGLQILDYQIQVSQIYL